MLRRITGSVNVGRQLQGRIGSVPGCDCAPSTSMLLAKPYTRASSTPGKRNQCLRIRVASRDGRGAGGAEGQEGLMSTADSTSATGVLASSDDRLPKDVKQVGVVVVLGTIMAILDTTIVAVALAPLARDFHTSITTIQWVTTGYLLALAVVIPLSGWAVHRFGAKPVYIVSLALFITGSALCGLAWSAGVLVAFRVLPGLGGGMIMAVGQTIMAR